MMKRGSSLDSVKTIDTFYRDTLVHELSEVPDNYNNEPTYPKPKTVVHWGQLKMFVVLLLFLVKKVDMKKTTHIIYPGSARGDNILLLMRMFPNTLWYLVDPNPFHPELYGHKQTKEIRNEYFTDKLAEEYGKKFKNRDFPLLFISDIRESPEDKDVIEDNESQAKWHVEMKPDFSYLKFRCPFDSGKTYDFYKGKIYVQAFAPPRFYRIKNYI